MSFGAARAAIRAFLEAGFTDTPLVWPNEQRDMPDAPASFVAVEVLGVENMIRGVGVPGQRLSIHSGIILAHVFTPFGIGSGTGDAYADTLSALLARQEFPAPTLPQMVRTEDATTRDGEIGSDDGNYWRVSVSVPFDFYYLT